VLITAGDTITKTDYYTTVEEQQIFSKAFPEMVALFQQVTQGKEKQRRRKKGLVFIHFVMNSFQILLSACFRLFVAPLQRQIWFILLTDVCKVCK